MDPLQLIVDELTATTEVLRELEFLTPPDLVFVTETELAERVRALIEDELDPAETRRDELLLTTLGLVENGTDLAALYVDLYSEQVAGFYDGETGELVVSIGDGELSQLQRLTLVHELTHALTDQHFGFADRLVRLDDDQRYENLTALTAVAEGDATLIETLYLGALTWDEQLAVLSDSMEVETEDGFQPINSISKTIEYEIWVLTTEDGLSITSPAAILEYTFSERTLILFIFFISCIFRVHILQFYWVKS